MQYILKTLDDLIVNQMNPSLSRIFSNEYTLKHWLHIAQIEANQIKEFLYDEMHRIPEPDEAAYFISKHHSRLIYLSDKLLVYIEQNTSRQGEIPENLVSVQKAIFLVVNDLLHFIWKHYAKYCDKDQKIPENYRIFLCREFAEKSTKIFEYANRNTAELLNIALWPLKKVIAKPRIKLTFRAAFYLTDLLQGVMEYSSNKDENTEIFSLLKCLVYYNYNSIHFKNYFITYLRQELAKIDSLIGQMERLSWFIKTLNQTPVKPNIAFNLKQTGIKEFLIEWLLEELSYRETKANLARLPIPGEAGLDQNYKVETSLSVPQVACLIRLLVETGIIKNKNKTELIKFYAQYTQTKRQENITFHSFKSKFYNIEESSKQTVKELIIRFLNEIRDL